jgi:hypothetical protein
MMDQRLSSRNSFALDALEIDHLGKPSLVKSLGDSAAEVLVCFEISVEDGTFQRWEAGRSSGFNSYMSLQGTASTLVQSFE